MGSLVDWGLNRQIEGLGPRWAPPRRVSWWIGQDQGRLGGPILQRGLPPVWERECNETVIKKNRGKGEVKRQSQGWNGAAGWRTTSRQAFLKHNPGAKVPPSQGEDAGPLKKRKRGEARHFRLTGTFSAPTTPNPKFQKLIRLVGSGKRQEGKEESKEKGGKGGKLGTAKKDSVITSTSGHATRSARGTVHQGGRRKKK